MIRLEQFRQKLVTAESAVKAVKSGDRVYVHPGCATPEILVQALMRRAGELREVEIVHMMTFGRADYVEPRYEGVFRHNALFMGGNVRAAVGEGRADYTPVFLGEIEDLFISGAMPIDVVFMQVSPPDEHGYMSLGVGVDCTLTHLLQ